MNPWQPGDPVGRGRIYLPDAATRQAYADECRRGQLECLTNYVADGWDRVERNRRMGRVPLWARERVRTAVVKRRFGDN